MEMEEEEKLCSNCKKRISAKNYLMHTMHCQRNIVLCPSCDEPVPKTEIENHNQLHVKTGCPKCRKPLEKCDLAAHEKYDCPKRMIACAFCELECAADEMTEHLEYCGSRTEECSKCGQFILLKEKAIHDQMACSPPRETTRGRNNGDNNGMGPVPFLGLNSSPMSLGTPEGGRGDSMLDEEPYPWHMPLWHAGYSNRLPDEDADEYEGDSDGQETVLLPCEFCGKSFSMDDIILHQSGCELEAQNSLHGSESTQPRPESPAERTMGVVTIPCEFCSKFFSEKNIDLHQAICLHTHNIDETVPKRVPSSHDVTATTEIPVVHTRRVVINESSNAEGDSVMLPCEFCERLFSEQVLSQHQATCDRNPDQAIASDQLYPIGHATHLLDAVLSSAMRSMSSDSMETVDETVTRRMNIPPEDVPPVRPEPRRNRPVSSARVPQQYRESNGQHRESRQK